MITNLKKLALVAAAASALSVGAFGIGVTEFAPMGLLPVIAKDLGVSIPAAGMLISGYAHPKSEFSTPWRVINFNACNSCYNDTTVEFDRADFNWCPRHADEESGRYQCTSAITPEHVMRVIDPLVVTGLR